MRDDPAWRRLVVVRRHDEDAVGAGLVRLLRQVDGVRGRVRPRAGDDRRPVADRRDRRPQELEPLLVGERRRLTGRAGDDDPVGSVLDEEPAELLVAVVVDTTVGVEGRHRRGQDLAEHATILLPRPRGHPTGSQ